MVVASNFGMAALSTRSFFLLLFPPYTYAGRHLPYVCMYVCLDGWIVCWRAHSGWLCFAHTIVWRLLFLQLVLQLQSDTTIYALMAPLLAALTTIHIGLCSQCCPMCLFENELAIAEMWKSKEENKVEEQTDNQLEREARLQWCCARLNVLRFSYSGIITNLFWLYCFDK